MKKNYSGQAWHAAESLPNVATWLSPPQRLCLAWPAAVPLPNLAVWLSPLLSICLALSAAVPFQPCCMALYSNKDMLGLALPCW